MHKQSGPSFCTFSSAFPLTFFTKRCKDLNVAWRLSLSRSDLEMICRFYVPWREKSLVCDFWRHTPSCCIQVPRKPTIYHHMCSRPKPAQPLATISGWMWSAVPPASPTCVRCDCRNICSPQNGCSVSEPLFLFFWRLNVINPCLCCGT